MKVKDLIPLIDPNCMIRIVFSKTDEDEIKQYFSGMNKLIPYYLLDATVRRIYAYSGNIEFDVSEID